MTDKSSYFMTSPKGKRARVMFEHNFWQVATISLPVGNRKRRGCVLFAPASRNFSRYSTGKDFVVVFECRAVEPVRKHLSRVLRPPLRDRPKRAKRKYVPPPRTRYTDADRRDRSHHQNHPSPAPVPVSPPRREACPSEKPFRCSTYCCAGNQCCGGMCWSATRSCPWGMDRTSAQ